MKTLNQSLMLRNTVIKNRICVPPMVVCTSDDTGIATDTTVSRYREIAKGGAGLIIQEATCISKRGRLHERQLGIWDDVQIPMLKKVTDAVHAEGSVIVVQIHHAGVNGIDREAYCPSGYRLSQGSYDNQGIEMTGEQIEETIAQFIAAAKRAEQAGYDGIELHGCHSYLISAFLNSRVNRRTDEWADGMHYAARIIEGIRAETGADFILGIRLGAYEPTITEGIDHAKKLEQLGVDFIDVSYGFGPESDAVCPSGFPLKEIIWAAGEIKKHVNLPVFAVNSIVTPQQAQQALELTDADMIDIGRSILVDPEWPGKALRGETPGRCLFCKGCRWFPGMTERCPGRLLMNRGETN